MSGRKPLLPSDWKILAPLVDQLLDAPLSERPALFDALAGDSASRRAELERLLAECERALPLLEHPAAERFSQLRHEDDGPPFSGLLGGRYRIEREVGRGGMSRVYLAHDVRHSRRVAVKVISHEIASSLARERFLREIGIAARLRHPNIMPLYDSGDVDEMLYFVMPFEEGKSLRARLDKERRLGVAEGVSILRDIARALACAHEQNVVHRDIKPDNVLLAGDAAVVTDFGIAKALTVAATEAGFGSLTHAGTAIGTPAYMSPEQAIGDPTTDHRADIYAFGCLAYEVFAGTPPFAGTTAHQIISAQLSERPKPLADHRPDVPDAVARLIHRCLEKDPAARPTSAAELLDSLGTLSSTNERAVGRRRPLPRVVAAIVGLALIGLGGWYAASINRGGPVSVTVLPFEVIGDSAEALAAGFSDDLASALVRKPWLLVKSLGGARNYRGQGAIDNRTVGDSLGVRYLVMGSMRGKGSDLSLTLKLIKCDDNSIIWNEKFIGRTDLEALRDEIAKTVGDSLRRPAGRFATAFVDMTPQKRVNKEAYALYLLGKRMLIERHPQAMDSAAEKFKAAIAIDSNSADAWSGMSLSLAVSAAFVGRSIDSVSRLAKASAEHALRLDSSLAEPHVALGIVHGLYWEWATAETEFKNALRRRSQDKIEARIQYMRVLNALDRPTDANAQMELALEEDGASSMVLAFKSMQELLIGRPDSALIWNDRAMQISADNLLVRYFRALVLAKLNERAKARDLVLRTPVTEPYLLYALAASGDTAEVRKRLLTLTQADPRTETTRAYAFLGSGDTNAALDALQRATDRHEIWPTISAPKLPVFDAVRDNPRFRKLLIDVGLAKK